MEVLSKIQYNSLKKRKVHYYQQFFFLIFIDWLSIFVFFYDGIPYNLGSGTGWY